jgi:hypothetical protein
MRKPELRVLAADLIQELGVQYVSPDEVVEECRGVEDLEFAIERVIDKQIGAET